VIRLTLRQFRIQATIALGAVVALAVMAVVTRSHLVQLYHLDVAGCSGRGNCNSAINSYLNVDHTLHNWLNVLVVVVPGLLGVFWGATLVTRELETGTYRLAWTQSVTRTRWLITKVAVVGLAAMATAGLMSLVVTWWASPLDRAGEDRFGSFDMRGIVPIGHAAFALALGIAIGLMVRRVLPTMAATLVVFVAARLMFTSWARPHLLPALHRTDPLTRGEIGFGSQNGGPFTLQAGPPRMPNAWISSARIVDRAGHDLPASVLRQTCPQLGDPGSIPRPQGGGPTKGPAPQDVVDPLRRCVAQLAAHYHQLIVYQPAHRYWPLQWLELGVYLAAALALVGFSLWWVRRRLV
jgi:hypothetical protein